MPACGQKADVSYGNAISSLIWIARNRRPMFERFDARPAASDDRAQRQVYADAFAVMPSLERLEIAAPLRERRRVRHDPKVRGVKAAFSRFEGAIVLSERISLCREIRLRRCGRERGRWDDRATNSYAQNALVARKRRVGDLWTQELGVEAEDRFRVGLLCHR